MTEFSDGTILKEIDRINRQISEKLEMEIELNSKVCVKGHDKPPDVEARLEIQEKKLDAYLFKFMELNARSGSILEEAKDSYKLMLDGELQRFNRLLAYNLGEMKTLAQRQNSKEDGHGIEMQNQVQYIHDEF